MKSVLGLLLILCLCVAGCGSDEDEYEEEYRRAGFFRIGRPSAWREYTRIRTITVTFDNPPA